MFSLSRGTKRSTRISRGSHCNRGKPVVGEDDDWCVVVVVCVYVFLSHLKRKKKKFYCRRHGRDKSLSKSNNRAQPQPHTKNVLAPHANLNVTVQVYHEKLWTYWPNIMRLPLTRYYVSWKKISAAQMWKFLHGRNIYYEVYIQNAMSSVGTNVLFWCDQNFCTWENSDTTMFFV